MFHEQMRYLSVQHTPVIPLADLTDYLRFVFKHLDEFHDHPEKLAPFAIAQSLQKNLPAITMPST